MYTRILLLSSERSLLDLGTLDGKRPVVEYYNSGVNFCTCAWILITFYSSDLNKKETKKYLGSKTIMT